MKNRKLGNLDLNVSEIGLGMFKSTNCDIILKNLRLVLEWYLLENCYEIAC